MKLHPTGDTPPLLEEHTMITSGEKIFVFGGVCRMSVDGETPLWIFDTGKKYIYSDFYFMLPIFLQFSFVFLSLNWSMQMIWYLSRRSSAG